MISLAIRVHSDRYTHADTHRRTVHIQTRSRSDRIEVHRPGLAVQGLLVSGIKSTSWANGQTERVNSVTSEMRPESICCLRSRKSHVLCCRAEGKRERVVCLDWNTYTVMVFHKKQPYHRTFDLNSCWYLCICSTAEYCICAKQRWIFDMYDKGFFALGAFWPIAVVHYPTECVLPFWDVSSNSCTHPACVHANTQVCIYITVHWKDVSPHGLAVHTPPSLGALKYLYVYCSYCHRRPSTGSNLLENLAETDSVMTLHIALNCFIGKMIVLVQFE